MFLARLTKPGNSWRACVATLHAKNGIVKGELDGLKFVGFVDENGKIKNSYPTFVYKD